jgi:hypothetical protein
MPYCSVSELPDSRKLKSVDTPRAIPNNIVDGETVDVCITASITGISAERDIYSNRLIYVIFKRGECGCSS